MKAGPELDALIMKHVLSDWVYCKSSFEQYEPSRWSCKGEWVAGSSFKPSERIEDAWKVVEKLRELNGGDVFEFRLTWSGTKNYPGTYKFRIWESDLPNVDLEEFRADTAPEAICLAALKAVGYEE